MRARDMASVRNKLLSKLCYSQKEGQLGHTFSQRVTCCAVLLPLFLRNRPFNVSMEVMNDVNTLLKFALSLEGMAPCSVTDLYTF